MKNATIAWGLVVVFFTTTVLFACLYLSERHTLQRTETVLDMTEKSEAELRSNVQAAIAQSDKQDAQAAAQSQASSIYGVYNCPDVQNYNQFDLRSDGTVASYFERQDGSEMLTGQKATWELDGGTVWITKNAGMQKFTVEQDDLIDSRGNRWIHTR